MIWFWYVLGIDRWVYVLIRLEGIRIEIFYGEIMKESCGNDFGFYFEWVGKLVGVLNIYNGLYYEIKIFFKVFNVNMYYFCYNKNLIVILYKLNRKRCLL